MSDECERERKSERDRESESVTRPCVRGELMHSEFGDGRVRDGRVRGGRLRGGRLRGGLWQLRQLIPSGLFSRCSVSLIYSPWVQAHAFPFHWLLLLWCIILLQKVQIYLKQ